MGGDEIMKRIEKTYIDALTEVLKIIMRYEEKKRKLG